LYWKTRFPLFDSIDYELDSRHYRIMFTCLSKVEVQSKMAYIQSNPSLCVIDFENNLYYLRDHYAKNEFRQLLPFVFYEDTVNAFTIEVHEKDDLSLSKDLY